MRDEDMDWLVRDTFTNAGTLMVGDLRVIKKNTNILEVHPFPEWVVQLYQLEKPSGTTYAILPHFTEKDVECLKHLKWEKRVEKIRNLIDMQSEEDFIAIEYKDGVSIKIPENIPHEFISVFNEEENCPYCQVFEPNMEEICNIFHYTPTEFFNLNFELKIT